MYTIIVGNDDIKYHQKFQVSDADCAVKIIAHVDAVLFKFADSYIEFHSPNGYRLFISDGKEFNAVDVN